MSTRFKLPKSHEELLDLQRQTTELLRQHRVRIALSKLSPRGANVETQQAVLARYETAAALYAAAGKPSAATAATYEKIAGPLINEAFEAEQDVWQLVVEKANHPKTWYLLKAAMQYVLVDRMRRAKQIIDGWDRADPQTRAIDDVSEAFRLAVPVLVASANALDAMPVGGLPPKLSGVSVRSVKSKSASIRGKPADWREQIASRLEGELQLAYLIQAISGCRNEEILKGVSVVLLPDGLLDVTVAGAKVGKHAGQLQRSFTVAVNSGGVAAMLGALLEGNVPVNSSQLLAGEDREKTKDKYRKAVARASQSVFPPKKGKQGLSAYSLRHQFKKDVSTSADRETVAKAMGHSTTRSATYYGAGGKAGGGTVTPLNVKATRPVKQRLSIHAKASKTQRAAIGAAVRKGSKPKM